MKLTTIALYYISVVSMASMSCLLHDAFDTFGVSGLGIASAILVLIPTAVSIVVRS